MKILLSTFLLILIFDMSTSNAQLIRSYGIKAGFTSANQNWDWLQGTGVTYNSKSRVGADAGLFIEWLNIPFISFITEVDYIQKGSEVNTNIPITTAQNPDGLGQYYGFSTRINYLSVPILVKLRLYGKLLTPYILFGPRFDFKLSGSSNLNGNSSSNIFKSNDVGGTFGIGFDFKHVLPFHIGAEFRYSPSFRYCYSVKYLSVKNSSLEFLMVLSY